MASRDKIVSFLDDLLRIAEVKDPYCPNGLQVEGKNEVSSIGFAVDACQQSFEALHDCDMIITHHGLFWPAVKSIRGAMKRSLSLLFERDINLYPVHLPLDVHEEFGNNVQLIEALGWEKEARFGEVGWTGTGKALERDDFCEELKAILGSDIRLLGFGEKKIQRIAVSSGGGSIGLLHAAKATGAQILVTGEASHPIYHAAKEMGFNLVLAGHYATETWGVKSLMPLLEDEFSVTTRFVDFPTGF